MNSPLKKLDQSVFDGLPSEYKFAAVDSNGWAFAYEKRPRPYVEGIDGFGFDGMCRSISGKFDATDWQNSLIEREEEASDDDANYVKSALSNFAENLKKCGLEWLMRVPETEYNAVNHPEHYTANSHGIECIDVIDAATEHLTGIEAVCTANAIKYLWRWKRKNGIQDLHKAKWYINHLIDCLIDNQGETE